MAYIVKSDAELRSEIMAGYHRPQPKWYERISIGHVVLLLVVVYILFALGYMGYAAHIGQKVEKLVVEEQVGNVDNTKQLNDVASATGFSTADELRKYYAVYRANNPNRPMLVMGVR